MIYSAAVFTDLDVGKKWQGNALFWFQESENYVRIEKKHLFLNTLGIDDSR